MAGGGAAEAAARKKEVKYSQLMQHYHFFPVAFETLRPVNESGANFLVDIGRRMRVISGDNREGSFLFQRLSVALQRYNAVCFRNSFFCESDSVTEIL